MIDSGMVTSLVCGWWFDYDQGNFEAWPAYFTQDAHFTCRTDTGQTAYEEFVRADVRGREAVLAWQEDHRRHSPYPLRHNGTNVHIAKADADEVEFRSYIFVTQIVGGAVSNLSTGRVTGRIRSEDDALRFAGLHVVLDTLDSAEFNSVAFDALAVPQAT
jgi:3-phenylpropionate/cinnamic acid dioxygenase small subunit